jgi:hypothetical protein
LLDGEIFLAVLAYPQFASADKIVSLAGATWASDSICPAKINHKIERIIGIVRTHVSRVLFSLFLLSFRWKLFQSVSSYRDPIVT